MKEKLLQHLKDRDSINKELKAIMGYCDDSPIYNDLDKRWYINGDEFRLEADTKTPLDIDYYGYIVSSLGAKGEELFMGEKDGTVYIMIHNEDNWRDTQILILDKAKQVILEDE